MIVPSPIIISKAPDTPATLKSEYLGQTGVALTVLRPAGAAMVGNKRLDVVSVGDFIDADVSIQVIGVEGSKIMVEKKRRQTN